MFRASGSIFDTIVDTKRINVSIKIKFLLRDYVYPDGTSPLVMHVTGSGLRERINIDINIERKKFDPIKQKILGKDHATADLNLLLENYLAKVTELKTAYRLSGLNLTPAIVKNEILGGYSRINFVYFFKAQIALEKSKYSEGTIKRYESVVKKLEEYNPIIPFTSIDVNFFKAYRNYLIDVKKNAKSTVNGNIIAIKTFLKIAHKSGVKLALDLDDLIGGSTHGNRTYLNPIELKKLFEYYESSFITESYKLVLGYFLFASMTGLRISNIQALERSQLTESEIAFVNFKSKVDQFSIMNMKARLILKTCENLFVTKFTDSYMNTELKKIGTICGITKKISFHVSRHTFATCFLRPEIGGTVHHLQKLLKHKNIETTMVYSHILESEANKEVFRLDKLF